MNREQIKKLKKERNVKRQQARKAKEAEELQLYIEGRHPIYTPMYKRLFGDK
jgi:hypothetical protein